MGLNGGLAAARRELLASLARLPADCRFQVILYNRFAEPLPLGGGGALVPATELSAGAEAALRTWTRPGTPLPPGAEVPAGSCVTLDVQAARPLAFTLRVPDAGRWVLVED